MPPRKYGAILPDVLTGWSLRQFCMVIPNAPEYREAFWGQVYQLATPGFWEKDGPEDERDEIAARVWLDVLNDPYNEYLAGGSCEQTDSCRTYRNTASFISYYPNDPRYTPDLVPEGYTYPPWYFATAVANLLYATQDGDIITTLDRIPPGSLPTILPASGLPRIRISTEGAGTVRAHFRNMFAGSSVQITRDDDPLTVFFLDGLRDAIAVPPESVDQVIVEVEHATPGPHVIDFIVVSQINDQIPYLFHGAGLIKVELCGLLPAADPEVPSMEFDGYPIGAVVPYYAEQAPQTTLDCDGAQYLRVDYPELYDILAAKNTALIIDADNFVTPNFDNAEITQTPVGETLQAALDAVYSGKAGAAYHRDYATMFQHDDGTGTPEIGQPVGYIEPMVGAVNMIAPDANRPTLTAVGLQFTEAASSYLRGSALGAIASGNDTPVSLWWFGALDASDSSDDYVMCFGNQSTGTQLFNWTWKGNPINTYGANRRGDDNVYGGSDFGTPTPGETYALCMMFNGLTFDFWQDDALIADGLTLNSGAITLDDFAIMARPQGGVMQGFATGTVRAWGIIEGELSQADWLRIYDALIEATPQPVTLSLPYAIVAKKPTLVPI